MQSFVERVKDNRNGTMVHVQQKWVSLSGSHLWVPSSSKFCIHLISSYSYILLEVVHSRDSYGGGGGGGKPTQVNKRHASVQTWGWQLASFPGLPLYAPRKKNKGYLFLGKGSRKAWGRG